MLIMIRQGGEALAMYLRADCDAFGQHEREFANRSGASCFGKCGSVAKGFPPLPRPWGAR